MSLVNLSHVCSHLQNASRARLGLTSIPLSRMHLSLSLLLQKQGFLSTVTLGGPAPPPSLVPDSTFSTFDHTRDAPSAATSEAAEPTTKRDAQSGPGDAITQENRASRRLWLGLKYWDGEPVLRRMKMLSKPTKRIWLDSEDIGKIVRGREAGFVKGLTGVGECLFVSTDRGVMEARECVERKVGGMVLCRVE
ncbi:hypothetical protein LTR50_006763 [Elasticomyces elasticus]|nr:hypothetical protein LTR50_006763 [Elasticomyces elasticus]